MAHLHVALRAHHAEPVPAGPTPWSGVHLRWLAFSVIVVLASFTAALTLVSEQASTLPPPAPVPAPAVTASSNGEGAEAPRPGIIIRFPYRAHF